MCAVAYRDKLLSLLRARLSVVRRLPRRVAAHLALVEWRGDKAGSSPALFRNHYMKKPICRHDDVTFSGHSGGASQV
jgi:hypothetical protein